MIVDEALLRLFSLSAGRLKSLTLRGTKYSIVAACPGLIMSGGRRRGRLWCRAAAGGGVSIESEVLGMSTLLRQEVPDTTAIAMSSTSDSEWSSWWRRRRRTRPQMRPMRRPTATTSSCSRLKHMAISAMPTSRYADVDRMDTC
jgi:hypothetical protein